MKHIVPWYGGARIRSASRYDESDQVSYEKHFIMQILLFVFDLSARSPGTSAHVTSDMKCIFAFTSLYSVHFSPLSITQRAIFRRPQRIKTSPMITLRPSIRHSTISTSRINTNSRPRRPHLSSINQIIPIGISTLPSRSRHHIIHNSPIFETIRCTHLPRHDNPTPASSQIPYVPRDILTFACSRTVGFQIPFAIHKTAPRPKGAERPASLPAGEDW